jgi:hypothetical protein
MIKKIIELTTINIVGLLFTNIALPQTLVSGGLQNAGNPGPTTVTLNLVYDAMNAEMSIIKAYVSKNGKCPAAGHFGEQAGNLSINNGASCDVITRFGYNNPGPLSGKTIRMVIKNGNANPDAVDFSFRQTISDIDFGSNGVTPSFLKNPPRAFAYSNTIMPSSFGNVPSAGVHDVLTSTYQQIANESSAANPTSSSSIASSDTDPGTFSYNIR